MVIGKLKAPVSSMMCEPVNSPLPFWAKMPANTGVASSARGLGRMAVTPVRTGPLPTTSAPSPEISVEKPTATPATSVMALNGPGVPSKRMPKARARCLPEGVVW